MNSPFKGIDDAFDPMFNECVVISGRHGTKSFKQTIEACVFTCATADALDDMAIDTNREDIHIVCKQKDYAFVQALQRGDVVDREATNGVRYRISDVRRDALMGWVIDARSI